MSFEAAKAAFLQGLACWQAGRAAEAEAHYLAALALLPGRASTLINLAAVQLALGKPDAALLHAEQALAAEPGDADALLHRAHALAQLGRLHEALAPLDALLAQAPQHAGAWASRGNLLRELGRLPEAAQAYRQALQHGGDEALNRYALAAVQPGDAPAPNASPEAYVQQLFDHYAAGFEQHLVQGLGYRAHEDLMDLVHALAPGRWFDGVLDLGCGTGLAAPRLRQVGGPLHGLDLSAGMLARAQATGHYARLQQAEASAHLATTPGRYALVLATDVLIYIGPLDALLAGLRRVLAPQGLFAFSAELAPQPCTQGWQLLPSLRYAHSPAYLRAQAAQQGLQVLAMQPTTLRHEQGQPVAGLLVVMQQA